MVRKRFTFFDLVRLPNCVTAGADSLAGYIIAATGVADWSVAVRLIIASMLLYAGGVALNDVADAQQDARARPERPIPSGRITRRQAGWVSIALMLAGVAMAWSVGKAVGLVGVGVVLAVIGYDVVFKRTVVAPAVMGLCRALNLSLGLVVVDLDWLSVLVPASILWLYVSALTLFARRETEDGRRTILTVGMLGVCFAVLAAMLAIPDLGSGSPWSGYVFGVPLLFTCGYFGAAATKSRDPRAVQAAVKIFVLGIVCLDATMVATRCGWELGLLPLGLLVPSVFLARFFRVT